MLRQMPQHSTRPHAKNYARAHACHACLMRARCLPWYARAANMVSGLVIKREGDAVTLTTLEQVVDRKLVLCVARDVEYTQAPVADLVRKRCVRAHAYARNVPYTHTQHTHTHTWKP